MLKFHVFCVCFSLGFMFLPPSQAQTKKTAELKAPEPGYIFPAGGQPGQSSAVTLGGYDWTPDIDLIVLDSPVTLAFIGEQGPVLVPPPPHWFGQKAYLTAALLPRERPAKLTIPASTPSGPLRWTVTSASGAGTKTGIFCVGPEPSVTEVATKLPQLLPVLPVAVHGRLAKIEEVDRYRFTVSADGPVTCEIFARRLGVPINAAITIRDETGNAVADVVDTDGRDPAFTFRAKAKVLYTVELHDFDFRGDASYVYRMVLKPGPRLVGTIPAFGKKGGLTDAECILDFGDGKFVSEKRMFQLPTSELPESVAIDSTKSLPGACGITGVLDTSHEARFTISWKRGEAWQLHADARKIGSPLDVSIAILDGQGKELARNDDLPNTTDAGLLFNVPTDGTYTLVVSDQSGRTGNRAALYHLSVSPPPKDFVLTTVPRLNVPLGGTAELLVKLERRGGFKDDIHLAITGLPDGVSVPEKLVFEAQKAELKIVFTGLDSAPASAKAITITGTAGTFKRSATAPIPGSLANLDPDAERTKSIVVTTTLAPRLRVVAVEADGGRKVHRGSTHPAEVTVERLEGFVGEVSLQMSAAQSYQRQGITGPELTVPATDAKAFYPCFMPEWLETTRTSRMELIGVVKVPDAKGRIRYLTTPMVGRITMSIEGAILKITADAKEPTMKPGDAFPVPVTILRSAKLKESVKLELIVDPEFALDFRADPTTVPAEATSSVFRLNRSPNSKCTGDVPVTIRGTALQNGKYAVVSEATIVVRCAGK